jgi:tight adherence protein C
MDQALVLTILASIFSGIAAGCFFLAVVGFMQQIHVDKDMTQETKQLPILIKIFMPFTPNLNAISKAPIFDVSRLKAEDLILMAGYDEAITGNQFISVRILSACAGIVVFFLLMSINMPAGLLMCALLVIYPSLWLKATVKKRHLDILKALPNVLDLLTLSVEAGKDFLTSMRDILARRKPDALGEELKRTLHEIQLGKQRQAALKELVRRVKQPELTSVINAIIQAEELGVSIAQLLKIQGDQLRAKRFSRAEKLANEAPVKILIPVVLFIFPPVFIILMGPILIQAMKTMMK